MHSEALRFFRELLGTSTSIGHAAVHFPQFVQTSSSTFMRNSERDAPT